MKRLSTNIILLAIVTFLNVAIIAQDGEALFKAKCNACHLVDKASTGPLLKGVIQKWTDAGEVDMLTEWVKNSASLIASGKSKMANEIKGFSPSEMPAQDVTPEEATAILTYVDRYAAPVAAPIATEGIVEPVIETVPNYRDNLTMFYWLLTAILALIITIIILASSIINLAKSDYFRKKLTEQSQKEKSGINTTLIAIIAFFGIMASNNQSLAFSFINPGETAENSPWLLVEKMDLYYLITIIGILLLIVFYLKRMFNNLIEMIHPKVVEVIEDPQTLKKLNKVFNDIVPIEEEHTILMHHEYDGIRELDNNLPPWWVWMFFATIVFAFVYMFNFHVFKTVDLQIAEYEKDMKKSNKEVKAYLSEMSMNVDETSATLMTASDDLSQGKTLFETNCVTCHNPKGEGNIGPNLTDNFWLYGADIKYVFKTIKTGTPNGMPEHNSKFNPIQIQQVASFILSLPDAKGKEPQGVEVK